MNIQEEEEKKEEEKQVQKDDKKEIEEERRMFYVAMTRARKHLVISVCARYGNHAYYPSPFIKEALG